MKILVLSTGGTIGSQINSGIISPNSETAVKLLDLYYGECRDDVDFICEKIADTLSENIGDGFYETIINYLLISDLSSFDGVIILHGTDTLEYTASLVSMACRGLSCSVGFVSANLPLEKKNSNGVCNFKVAVGYIKAGGKGFFVPYRNHNHDVNIHLATRLTAADSVFDDFYSIGNCCLAKNKNDKIELLSDNTLPSQAELSAKKPPLISGEISLDKKILLIKSYPGIDYSAFDLSDKGIAAVLNLAYHSGTAPSCLSDFSKKCAQLSIDNYLCPVKNTDNLYESSAELFKAGVKSFPQMTVASSLAKLKLAYNTSKNPADFIKNNIYYENF